MLRLIPPGKTLKYYVVLSWVIPACLGLMVSVLAFFIVTIYDYRTNLTQEKISLTEKGEIISRRLAAELLIGKRGSVTGVSTLLKNEFNLASVEILKENPPCDINIKTHSCIKLINDTLNSYTAIPFINDKVYAVAKTPASKFTDFIRLQNLLWSTLPILLILSLGLAFQRLIIKSFFLGPIERLIETSVGTREPRQHWPKEIRTISEKLYKSFENRDTEVFSKMARGVFHDLRTLLHTPLCAVELVTEQMTNSEIRMSRLEHLYEVNRKQLPKINSIINNTLDGSRDIKLLPIQTSLTATIKSAIENVTQLAHQAHADILFNYQAKDIITIHDPIQLERALTNIIKNGIEAASENAKNNKKVFLNLIIESQNIQIDIEDSGTGLPDTSEKAFRLLKSTKTNGSGLGLLVSRKIIQAHKGVINISKSKNLLGAKFSIILPNIKSEVIV